MWTVTAAHFMLYTTDKCGIYWYSSLADTMDTTCINKLRFLLKSLYWYICIVKMFVLLYLHYCICVVIVALLYLNGYTFIAILALLYLCCYICIIVVA